MKTATSLQDCEAILLDIGGTLRRGKNPIDGAADFLKVLRRRKVAHYCLTNTTTISRQTLADQLNSFRFKFTPEQLLTANAASISYLKKEGISSIYLIGTADQAAEFSENGISVGSEQAEAVLVSLDYDLTYEKLATASRLIRKGAKYIATNSDANLVRHDGLSPDAGANISFINTTTGQEPVITGKPHQLMMDLAIEQTGVPANKMAIIGDGLTSDMKMAQDFGMVSVLVLSGTAQREDLATIDYQPDYIIESIGNLTPLFK